MRLLVHFAAGRMGVDIKHEKIRRCERICYFTGLGTKPEE